MSREKGPDSERRKSDEVDYFSGDKRYIDKKLQKTVVKIYSGDCYVTGEKDEMLVTILGSCVAACIRDPIARVGGMNHFLLPGNDSSEDSARFGAFAMEKLINEILKKGGKKGRLEVKVFGGGNVINNSAMIGSKNAAFVKSFLQTEGLKIDTEDLKGECPRRIHYYPDTGKVMLRRLQRADDKRILEEEKIYEKSLKAHVEDEGDVELF